MLTEEQRRAWMVAAAQVKSHPRLWQSGPLTGAMHFQGINSARARIGQEKLLWPPECVVFSPRRPACPGSGILAGAGGTPALLCAAVAGEGATAGIT